MTFLQRILCLHVLCVASCLVGAVRGEDAAPPPPQKNLILPGEVFEVAGRTAFVFTPASSSASESPKPWILYSPTLPAYPDKAEMWMHEQFVAGGVAVAGIDTGESYGSPEAVRAAEPLHAEASSTASPWSTSSSPPQRGSRVAVEIGRRVSGDVLRPDLATGAVGGLT